MDCHLSAPWWILITFVNLPLVPSLDQKFLLLLGMFVKTRVRGIMWSSSWKKRLKQVLLQAYIILYYRCTITDRYLKNRYHKGNKIYTFEVLKFKISKKYGMYLKWNQIFLKAIINMYRSKKLFYIGLSVWFNFGFYNDRNDKYFPMRKSSLTVT